MMKVYTGGYIYPMPLEELPEVVWWDHCFNFEYYLVWLHLLH